RSSRTLGSPAVYQLRPKKQKFGTLTRITVGEKNPKNPNKTILLVGETGAGKSTLINALVNYSMGVKFEDEVWFQIVEEEKKRQTESQTSDVIVYEIFGFEDETLPYSLTIIDTPGYGDTRGTEYDKLVTQRLLDLFQSEDGVHELHAVGLVMKASNNRLSDRQSYIIGSVMELFGNNMGEKIVAFVTHSDGLTPENALTALKTAKIKCARNEKDEPVHFLFNNQQTKERTQENDAALEAAWRTTENGMTDLRTFLHKTAPQELTVTADVLKERIQLAACIDNLKDRIEFIELKQTEVKQKQEGLQKNKEAMQKNETFTVEVDEPYKEKENIRSGGYWLGLFHEGAVSCTVCEETCHYSCTMALTPRLCEVMKGGRCTSCSKKCPASNHVKGEWRYVTKVRKVLWTNEEMKKMYEKNKSEGQNKSSILENLKEEMNQLTAEKYRFLNESYQHVEKLEQIALKADSISTASYLDFLLEKMNEEGDTEKVQKLEEMRSRVDEGTKSGVQYSKRK
uniref:AIG1-type G domain-containing protein n=1 Tax=Amphilophus citrinellus TaxID=61819 RepID=A0A3Q0RFF4_AMPCI